MVPVSQSASHKAPKPRPLRSHRWGYGANAITSLDALPDLTAGAKGRSDAEERQGGWDGSRGGDQGGLGIYP